jgi:hypothetical protein
MAVRLSALRADRPLRPGRFLVLISVRGWADPRAIVRLEGLGQLKISNINSSGNEQATFRLVAQCLNQRCYRVPLEGSGKVLSCNLPGWTEKTQNSLTMAGVRTPPGYITSRPACSVCPVNFSVYECMYKCHVNVIRPSSCLPSQKESVPWR